MAESDIEVGSTVRYVGFKRDVRDGPEGVVVGSVPQCDLLVVDMGGAIGKRLQSPGELELVLPKPSGEAPPLNTIDVVEGPDGTLWAVVRQSGDTVELNHPLAGCRYVSPDEVKQWPLKGRLDPSSCWAEDIQRLRARTDIVTNAPTLNSYDMVQDPDGTIWTVVRDSDEEVVELHNPLADRCHYALLRVVENWTRVGRLDASTEARFKRSHRCELASGTPTPSPAKTEPYNSELVGAVASAVRSDVEKLVTNESLNARVFDVLASSLKAPFTVTGITIIENSDPRPLKDAVNVIVDESGPGIAARNLQAPLRPRRRHQTTSWDPDMPLPDAEPGRYGWLP